MTLFFLGLRQRAYLTGHREFQVYKRRKSDRPRAMSDASLNTKVRQEGYLAGKRGLKAKDNPYPIPSHEALAWELGRSDHFKKRIRLAYQR